LSKFSDYKETNMASPQPESTTHDEVNQMIPERSENVILCWRCICMKRCKKH